MVPGGAAMTGTHFLTMVAVECDLDIVPNLATKIAVERA